MFYRRNLLGYSYIVSIVDGLTAFGMEKGGLSGSVQYHMTTLHTSLENILGITALTLLVCQRIQLPLKSCSSTLISF